MTLTTGAVFAGLVWILGALAGKMDTIDLVGSSSGSMPTYEDIFGETPSTVNTESGVGDAGQLADGAYIGSDGAIHVNLDDYYSGQSHNNNDDDNDHDNGSVAVSQSSGVGGVIQGLLTAVGGVFSGLGHVIGGGLNAGSTALWVVGGIAIGILGIIGGRRK